MGNGRGREREGDKDIGDYREGYIEGWGSDAGYYERGEG